MHDANRIAVLSRILSDGDAQKEGAEAKQTVEHEEQIDISFHDPREPGEEWSDLGWAADEGALTRCLARFAARYDKPLYVLEKDAASGRVVVGPKEALAATAVTLEDVRLHRPAGAVDAVRLRYHAAALACRVAGGEGSRLRLELDEPADSVAPGQLACLMRDDRVVGEGTIGGPG